MKPNPDIIFGPYAVNWYKNIESNGSTNVIPTMYQQILQPISGFPLASISNLPKNSNLPIEAKGIPNIG